MDQVPFIEAQSLSRKLFEAFNDNVNKQARNAGKIFCNSLNGNLAKFPTSYEDFQSLLDYKTQLMSALDIESIATPVSAKSYSIKPERPNIGYPDGGYLEIYDLITETTIYPDEKVKKSISKDPFSYQSREELSQPNSTLTQVGIDKVCSWTTSTPPHSPTHPLKLLSHFQIS